MASGCCSYYQSFRTPFEPIEKGEDVAERIQLSCFAIGPKIFPSFEGIRTLSPIGERVFQEDDIMYGIPYACAQTIKDAFDTACRIFQEPCRSKTYLEMVRIISKERYSNGWVFLAYDIALTVLSGCDKSQALGEVGLMMVAVGAYDNLPTIAHELLIINDHPIDTFRKVLKEICRIDTSAGPRLAETAQKIESSPLKIQVLAEAAIKTANNGDIPKAEKILNYLQVLEVPKLNPISPEISAMLEEVEDSIMSARTTALSLDEGRRDRNSKIYLRLVEQIEMAGKLPELPLEEHCIKREYDEFIILGKRAMKAQRFEDIRKIIKAIQNDVVEDEERKNLIILEIAENLARMKFDGKADYIGQLMNFVTPDDNRSRYFLQRVVDECDEQDRIEVGVSLAKKLLKGEDLELFFKDLIFDLIQDKQFYRIAWLLEQLDASYNEVKQKLILYIAQKLNEEGQERAFDLTKKLYANYPAPMEDLLETFIQIVVAEVDEKIRYSNISGDKHKMVVLIEQAILAEPCFRIYSERGAPISQNTYKLIAKALIRTGKFLEEAEEIIQKQITNEDDLCSFYSQLALEKLKSAFKPK